MPDEQNLNMQKEIKVDPNINYFGMTSFRNQNRKFGIKLDDRRRHMYVVGKTGMGKTTLLENMVLNDIYAGHGVGLVDPHGDFAEKIINYIPANRINDIVYFNPADIDYPIGFNILETIDPRHRHLVVSGLMGVFKKIWPDVWSPRMEYILNNTILALMEFPNTTLLGINRLLADTTYRRRVVRNIKDPVVKAFWETEFANYQDRFRTEAVAPIQNKVGQFLSASIIRNIVAQVRSRINIREIIDTKKIFLMNLAKGRIGEDSSRLLGGMLITKIQLAAMERVDIPESQRDDFFLYVDEFQNFATESFASILSEARKYHLDLIMAHQYMEQLDEKVLAAVIGNVGTSITFRVGSTDAEILAKEFSPVFVETDLVNLTKFNIYLKLMIDGVASQPFSATTLPPIGYPTASAERVIRVSRERYATSREKIEDKIMRWSGMEAGGGEGDEYDDNDENDEDDKGIIKEDGEKTLPPARAEEKQEFKPRQPLTPNEQGAQPNGQNRKKKKKKSKNKLNIREGGPVLLVDPQQKGMSLADALQINRPAPSPQKNAGRENDQREKSNPQIAPPTQPQPDIKKISKEFSLPTQNQPPKQNNPSSRQPTKVIDIEPGKILYPDRVVKIDDKSAEES